MGILIIAGIACLVAQVYALADLTARNSKEKSVKAKLAKVSLYARKGLAGCAAAYLLAMIGMLF